MNNISNKKTLNDFLQNTEKFRLKFNAKKKFNEIVKKFNEEPFDHHNPGHVYPHHGGQLLRHECPWDPICPAPPGILGGHLVYPGAVPCGDTDLFQKRPVLDVFQKRTRRV